MNQIGRVWIVTIAAADAIVEHLALQKRPVHIILIANLTVRVIGRNIQQLQCVVVIKITARDKTLLDNSPARMTWSTRLDLSQIRWRLKLSQSLAVFAIPEDTAAVG